MKSTCRTPAAPLKKCLVESMYRRILSSSFVATIFINCFASHFSSDLTLKKQQLLDKRKTAKKQVVVQPIRETIGEPVREICLVSEILEIGYVIVYIKAAPLRRF